MDRSHPSQWKYESPDIPGFHDVITPNNSPCRATWAFRLNLPKGQSHKLLHRQLELNAMVVTGQVHISHQTGSHTLNKHDSLYVPACQEVDLVAAKDAVLFIGGAVYEGTGQFFTRTYDLTLPLGDIHQVHGKPPYQREVFMTLAQQDAGSRLICGITRGEPGKWTSWPPHQHSNDLEEVYCYFDIPKPQAAFHFASREAGVFEHIHPVSTGDFVVIPEGYHPTCGMPGVSSCYFWIMAAFRNKSRRYDLAVNDPNFNL